MISIHGYRDMIIDTIPAGLNFMGDYRHIKVVTPQESMIGTCVVCVVFVFFRMFPMRPRMNSYEYHQLMHRLTISLMHARHDGDEPHRPC